MSLTEIRMVVPISVSEFLTGHLYVRNHLREIENPNSKTTVKKCVTYPSSSSYMGCGVYTQYDHRFSGYLPSWAQRVIGSNSIPVQGHTWDEYPYIVSTYDLPQLCRAYVRIDTLHVDQDLGDEHNKFNLSPSELRSRKIIRIDGSRFYDPAGPPPDTFVYKGKLPHRGPLTSDWAKLAHKSKSPHMCVYILLRIDFDLPLLRHKATSLLTEHLVRVLSSLQSLGYVWMDDWEKYVNIEGKYDIKTAIKEILGIDPESMDRNITIPSVKTKIKAKL